MPLIRLPRIADDAPPTPGLLRGAVPLLLLVVLLVTALPAAAAKAKLQDRLQRGETLLREGRFAEALEISGPLLHDVGPQLVASTVQGQESLGTVMGLHALALAGVAVGDGRPEDAGLAPVSDQEWEALFYWGLAQSLQPALRRSSLAAYGEVGRWLAGYRYDRECRLLKPGAAEGEADSAAQGEGGLGGGEPGASELWLERLFAEGQEALGEGDDLEPPVKLHAPPPVYNRKARHVGIVGEVVINSVIAPDGRVHHPCVLKTASPAFAYHLAEAVKEWRFEPAKKDGEPVAAYYHLTTNFRRGGRS